MKFCELNYGVTFENFEKINVNGKDADPLFVYLKEQQPKDRTNEGTSGLLSKLESLSQVFLGSELKWNFTKFLVDREGNVVDRFSPTFSAEEIDKYVKELL